MSTKYTFTKMKPRDLKKGQCYLVANPDAHLCILKSEAHKTLENSDDDFSAPYVNTYKFASCDGTEFVETQSRGYRDAGGSLTFTAVYSIGGFSGSLNDLSVIKTAVLEAFAVFHKDLVDQEQSERELAWD